MSWINDDTSAYNTFEFKHKNIFILFLVLFIIISFKLFYLQVVKGNYYRNIAEHQRLNSTKEAATRGLVYDCRGELLIGNQINYVAVFYPFEQTEIPSAQALEKINKILGKDITPLIEQSLKTKRIVKIAEGLDINRVFEIKEQKLFVPGINVIKAPKRKYFYSVENCHILGYVGEITSEELDDMKDSGLRRGDYIGKTGIEQFYDKYLRGTDGGLQLEVNARGQYNKTFKYYAPEIGDTVYLTIDTALQKVAYEALQNTPTSRGAAVVIDVKTGAVRALVSCPGYDLNDVFTKKYIKYLKNKNLPLFNRAIQAQYPPGSIFKIITAVAALDYLKFDPSTVEFCSGSFELGNRFYSCWLKSGHYKVNFFSAMANSCNIYFYKLGLALGVTVLEKYARMFYLGEKTNIDLPSEKKGFIPTPEWKKLKMKMSWLKGDTTILAIGQGALGVTPLQMATMMSAVANKGVFYEPYIVENIINPNTNEIVYEHVPNAREKISVSTDTWNILHKSLVSVVNNGTGKKMKFKQIQVAAKTGTAENHQGKDHAWTVAYAPADNPEVAIAVIVENGGFGGSVSGPVAREILRKYFNLEPDEPEPVKEPEAETETEHKHETENEIEKENEVENENGQTEENTIGIEQ
ncbi:penicillin-binding protein 2 [Candidatus Ruminimicrobium bovinum]|uniref:penicillin-binding protein 2 n=1 Tax=Candidatus Ruminimicrobium bovinum TaxID=3242779 RepID=UPI0039B8B5D7